jgi:DNA-binding transcriptional LysR family regulator
VLDVRRLKVLSAVVETGSISGAAAALGYTPSAVSQQITALERETRAVLLERIGRGIRPTDAALVLCEHAARVLNALQEAEDALSALRAGRMGRVRLGAFPTAGAELVPEALAAFSQGHPDIELDLVVAEADEAIAALHRGALDLAVAVQPFGAGCEPDDGLVRRHLLSDPFRIVLPKSHRLASRRRVDLAALADERWIGVTSSPGYCQEVAETACIQAGFRPDYGLDADEYPTAQGLVAAGLGVALMPSLALSGSIHPGVAVRRLKCANPAREVWTITRPAVADQVLVIGLTDALCAAAQRVVPAA